jgi:serine/threonine protein kinase
MAEQNDEELVSGFSEGNPVAEYSANKRFSHKQKLVAEGKYKKVYLAYDHDNGREVAWSSINLSTFSPENKERIIEDLQLFTRIDHPSFLKVIKSWHDNQKNELTIISELATCTLKQFVRNKLKTTRAKVMKVWIKDMLKGIQYLRSKNVVHGSIKFDNLFISASDSSIRIGLFNSLDKSRSASMSFDLKSLSYVLIELCTGLDLNYALIGRKELPKVVESVLNERIKVFIKDCFLEENPENLLSHPFLNNEEPSDSLPIELKNIEDYFEVFIEGQQNTHKCWVLIVKTEKIIHRTEFNFDEDVGESVAERIINDCKLPDKLFFEILEQLENFINTQIPRLPRNSFQDFSPISIQTKNIKDPFFRDTTPISAISNPFFNLSESKNPVKLSLKLEVKDLAHCKKFKIDLDFDPDHDSPRGIAQKIVSDFSLDQSELSMIARLINEKLGGSESETFSNFSNQDLLDLTEETHSKPCLNSTNEFSLPSEPSSLRSSYEPKDDHESKVVCGKGLKNDPKEVKQLQEALSIVLGIRVSTDGVFCLATEKNVKRFQEESGLTPTGVVCERLWDNLMIKAKVFRS